MSFSKNRLIILLCLFLGAPFLSHAQSDEINISASFAESLELRFTTSGSVNWTFSTIAHYTDGFWPADRILDFEVSASVNFAVQCQITPMVNGQGTALDMGNISIRVGVASDRLDQRGTRWEWAAGDRTAYTNGGGVARGDIFYGDKFAVPRTILVPGPQGNAGGYDLNKFKFLIGIGRYSQTQHNGMSRMIDQNIQPGVYTGTVILTAMASVS